MNIVVLDGHGLNPGDLSWDELAALGNLRVYPRTAATQLLERSSGAEALLTNKVAIDANAIAALPRLRYIGVLATGYNVVDTTAARSHGIVVTNIPAYSTDSVAQMTFAHILHMTNRVAHYARLSRQGRWSQSPDFCHWDTPLIELSGKTMGIVGLGNIGMKVARIARELGMHVLALTSKPQAQLPSGVHRASLQRMLAASDVLSLHCPLTQHTRGMICKRTLAMMKPGALLVNTARGQLVVEADVADALSSGRLGGYGADVMCTEPPDEHNALLGQPRAHLTPHIAWATIEARSRLMAMAAHNLRSFMQGRPVNVVN